MTRDPASVRDGGTQVLRRYILTGAPGSGKTSVALGLRRRGHAVVDEAVTDLIAAAQADGVDEPWSIESFLDDIVALQRIRQLATVPDGLSVQVFDRSPLCTLALARYLDLPVTPLLSAEVARMTRDRVYMPKVFLIRPLGFIEATAARRISYPDALAFQAVHEAVYREHAFQLVDVAPGPVEQRVTVVEHHVSGA